MSPELSLVPTTPERDRINRDPIAYDLDAAEEVTGRP